MKANKPNILWMMTDEQRTDSLGIYGSRWARTPFLDQLAREGVMFHNAITPAPTCQPARASILTGLYPSRTGIWWNNNGRDKREQPHLVPLFAEVGYSTATFGKQHYDSVNKAFETESLLYVGKEVDFFSYAEQYDEAKYNVVKYPPEPYAWILGGTFPEFMDKKVESRVIDQAIQWLEGHSEEQPFFLRVSFNGPHTPVVPPYPFDNIVRAEDVRFAPETEGPDEGQPKWISETIAAVSDSSRLTPEQIREARRFYYGEASFMDYQFGRLLDWMRKKGLLENTIIAFMSDHGTHIGDYGLVQKSTFYNNVVNVPYFFWYPSAIGAGVQINNPVETRSLLPTLLELAGIAAPKHRIADSLAHTLCSGEEPKCKPVFSEFSLQTFKPCEGEKWVMVRDGDWKMSVHLHPDPDDGALYNLSEDPFERNNVYFDSDYEKVVNRLNRCIIEHLTNEENHSLNQEVGE